jgi:hypothetical protein
MRATSAILIPAAFCYLTTPSVAETVPAATQFQVQLPAEARPFPEPLPAGRSEPGFKMRGIKGWGWTPEQYLEEIPVLAGYKLNFLMNCYLSMFSSLEPGA